MNENINLYEILKGHEGETFYSESLGYVRLHTVESTYITIMPNKHKSIAFRCAIIDAIDDIFPSIDQRDWNKWVNHKTPKTWGELVEQDIIDKTILSNILNLRECSSVSPILKSAQALLKIHQLIEVGYGGNVSYERCSELQYDNVYKIAPIGCKNNVYFNIVEVDGESSMNHIMFHTKEQAEEFLSYSENVQLLKDYFQII